MTDQYQTRSETARVRTSFMLVRSEWPVSKGLAFLRDTRISHVVIAEDRAEAQAYYLLTRIAALEVIARSSAEVTLHEALQLATLTPTQEILATPDNKVQATTAVFTDGRYVVGFIDVSNPHQQDVEIVRGTSRGKVKRSPQLPHFSAYPAITMPSHALPGGILNIRVGFRASRDEQVEDSGHIRIRVHDANANCLVVLIADGIALDRDSALIPFQHDAFADFRGTLSHGVVRASVKALFIYDQQVIGVARREVSAIDVEVPRKHATNQASNPCRMSLSNGDSAVDLTLSLNHVGDGILEWRLFAPACLSDAGTLALRTSLPNTKEFAADLMRDLRLQDFRGTFARQTLETVGQQVAALLPPKFFDVLRAVHAEIGRTPTLLLLTNETFVPWELAYLNEPLSPLSPPFLGAQTYMGRWIDDENVILPPAISIDVRRISAVASQYGLASGQRELAAAVAEQSTICEDWGGMPLQATRRDIETMVVGATQPGHLAHFAVHGYSEPLSNAQALLLADRTHLPASSLTGAYRCGQTPRFAFVFLNACQVGTPGRSLGQAGGFPSVLMRAGTMGFVAPLWEVHDDSARSMAEMFYRDAFSMADPIGTAMHTCRNRYVGDSTTPLAYIYYGHPGLRLNLRTTGAS